MIENLHMSGTILQNEALAVAKFLRNDQFKVSQDGCIVLRWNTTLGEMKYVGNLICKCGEWVGAKTYELDISLWT